MRSYRFDQKRPWPVACSDLWRCVLVHRTVATQGKHQTVRPHKAQCRVQCETRHLECKQEIEPQIHVGCVKHCVSVQACCGSGQAGFTQTPAFSCWFIELRTLRRGCRKEPGLQLAPSPRENRLNFAKTQLSITGSVGCVSSATQARLRVKH